LGFTTFPTPIMEKIILLSLMNILSRDFINLFFFLDRRERRIPLPV